MNRRAFKDIKAEVMDLTGIDTLKDDNFLRKASFALDRYSSLAMQSDGRWRFDDQTHRDRDGNRTFPIADTTLKAGEASVPLVGDFLFITQVQVADDKGDMQVVEPIDTYDRKHSVLRTEYDTPGRPRYYDFDSRSLFFYPASDTARKVRILYSRASPHPTSVNDEVGIPTVHHDYLVLYIAHRLGLGSNDSNREQIRAELNAYERNGGIIAEHYTSRNEDRPRRLKGSVPRVFTRDKI